MVTQESFVFSGAVADNVAFGRPEATREDVEAAAQAIGADAFISALPEVYDTDVGKRGSRLSAGQRQLVALARALIADPGILILDEATANVDVHAETAIEQGLRRLLAGRTAIVIAHRLSTVRNADRIAVLEGGAIVETGTHDELIEAGGCYSRLYREWAEVAVA
jgi:ATP-binding cassette subfamily B protein